MFTDISSSFLHSAQKKFASYKDVAYATLDFNRDPRAQGIEGPFDLIIASECLHTANDIRQTLSSLHGLLSVGGNMIMLESTRIMPGHGIAYGTFPDYWPDAEELNSPFLATDQWNEVLKQTGFSGVDVELDDYPPPLQIASTLLTTAVEQHVPRTVDPGQPPQAVHLICRDLNDEIVEPLTAMLVTTGVTPIVSTLENCDVPCASRVILTTNVGYSPLVDGREDEYEKVKTIVSQASSMLWLTDGDLLRGHNPKAAVVTGLVRMLITEDPSSKYGILHLEKHLDACDEQVLRQITDREHRLQCGDLDREIAMYEGVAHVSRLLVDPDLSQRFRTMNDTNVQMELQPLQGCGPVHPDFENPGLLSSLYFRSDEGFEQPLKVSWIEVRTAAIGLNWKDVATSAGRLDLDHRTCEFSGVVTACGNAVTDFQTGDEVYGFALRRLGGNFLRIPAVLARKVPPGLDMVRMSTVPVIFATAVYALQHLARLKRDERVLIQTATGGLGLAAVQLAQAIGAEVYATVGTADKGSYLVENFGICPERIFASRSTADIPVMMKATGQAGFDVVLSTSNGDVMYESWRCLARRGRFIDVGRVDVQNHGMVSMETFNRNATLSSFDIGIIVQEEEVFAGRLVQSQTL
jgi:NADPH:quinone reductase-like Zn-dependent oxidoreductase